MRCERCTHCTASCASCGKCSAPALSGLRCHIGLGANQAEHCKAELLLKPCEERHGVPMLVTIQIFSVFFSHWCHLVPKSAGV